MAIGTKATLTSIRAELAFTPHNLQDFASGLISADATDKARAGNTILMAGESPAIPFPAGSVGSKINRADIVNFVSALTKAVSVFTFQFDEVGCGVSYTRSSVWSDPASSTNNYTFAPATGAVITQANLDQANIDIRNLVNANRLGIAASFSFCHCSCHSSCHVSRGRR
ncbi:MAG: hypothetical protein KF789_13920 [Bdellovibrionaceae bacterium]|nr:hypothetical protein [Pseudobdellovibrionaceae bacterium]